MKLLLLFILSLANLKLATAQIDSEYIHLIHKRIRKIQPSGTIYYANHPDYGPIEYTLNYFNSRKFKSRLKDAGDSILTLTQKEQQYLISELKKAPKVSFPDSLFENSKCIIADSLVMHVERLNKQSQHSLPSIDDTIQTSIESEFKTRYWAFFFSNPIYIRNKSIFLTYFMFYDRSSGSQLLVFYKKHQDRWIPWIIAGSGDW